MKGGASMVKTRSSRSLAALAAGVLALSGSMAVQSDHCTENAADPAMADFSVEGMFVDCCSCMPPCPCELTEVAACCQGVGVHHISSGKYAGDDLVGVKIAHAKVVGEWVNLYVDAKDEKQRAAAEKFGRARSEERRVGQEGG